MSPQFRATLIKVHTAIAAFCLPVGLMFLITGGLYTAGIRGETSKDVFDIASSSQNAVNKDALFRLAKHELDIRRLDYPTGKVRYREKNGRISLKWNGLNTRIRLEPTANPRIFILTIKTPDWFQRFMQLHKAEGKTPFKIYAAVWATLLLTLFISGIAMAWQIKKLRPLVLAASLSGSMAFLALLYHSVWYA